MLYLVFLQFYNIFQNLLSNFCSGNYNVGWMNFSWKLQDKFLQYGLVEVWS